QALTFLGLVYEEAIPSITITSVTNVLSFAIGAITPTPEIRLFCFGTAIAMGLTYVYQLFLFGPVLSLATACEKHQSQKDKHESNWIKKVGRRADTVIISAES
ncbi:unnamed protein product, partial [Strongylus vulgaris]